MEEVSKSQKKRMAAKLTDLGQELLRLPASTLDKLPLSQELQQAIVDAKTMKSFASIRRQRLLIGKLIRETNTEALFSAYEQCLAESSAKTAHFQEVTEWRERLLQDKSTKTLTDFIAAHPKVDIQKLRQLIKKAQDEHNLAAQKALFRFLRSSS